MAVSSDVYKSEEQLLTFYFLAYETDKPSILQDISR